MVTSSRSGWRESTSSTSGETAALSRTDSGRLVSRTAVSASWIVRRSSERLGSSAATRSRTSAPSANISSTSRPAGILISASWRQVATGSLQPSISKVQAPGESGATEACQRPGSVASGRIRTHGRRTPSGPVSTTSAFSASCPSRNTTAVTGKDSPTVAFAG